MTQLPRPSQQHPIVVGPFTPSGRIVWIMRHDGTLTHPEAVLRNRPAYEHFAELCRPAAVFGPPEAMTWWADRPGEWPADE